MYHLEYFADKAQKSSAGAEVVLLAQGRLIALELDLQLEGILLKPQVPGEERALEVHKEQVRGELRVVQRHLLEAPDVLQSASRQVQHDTGGIVRGETQQLFDDVSGVLG